MDRFIWYYLAAISVVTVVVTCWDKAASKRSGARRTPEARLLLLALLGGSVAELLTMYLIRHKTKRKKFMLGLPLLIVLQAAACYLLLR